MTTFRLFCTTTLALAAAAPARAAPAYCSADGVRGIAAAFENLKSDDPFSALPAIINATCNPDRDATSHPEQIAAARDKWAKRLALVEADWAGVAQWSGLGNGQRVTALRAASSTAWSTLDPISQYVTVAGNDPLYFVDALGSKLSELGRFGYVLKCIESSKPAEWALCQPDIDALDAGKMFAEVRADTKHSPVEHVAMRVAIDGRGKPLAEHAAHVKEALAKDPAYGKLFALAASTRKAWDAAPPDGKLADLALAMDDARIANSRSAFAGCDDATWKQFTASVGAIPAKKFAAIKNDRDAPFILGAVAVLVNDRDAYLAGIARYMCTSEKPDVFARFFGNATQRWPGFRGPRSAAFTAMLKAGIELDDRSAKVEFPEVRRMWFTGGEGISGGGDGAIAAIKPSGATATIEFAKKMRKAQVCAEWRDEHRISMISASGTVYYEYTCIKYKTEMVNDAPPPVTVDAHYIAGVKPGMVVAVLETVVTAVWAKPGESPTAVLGVPMK